MKELTWLEAIEVVLKDASEPMHYSAIAEAIANRELKRTLGATPAATVGANLYMSVKKSSSPFQKMSKGFFSIKDGNSALDNTVDVSPESSVIGTVASQIAVEADTGALQSFGMYWRRDDVMWSGSQRLLGRQTENSDEVNFAAQVGVYLLHDRDRVIYVGRASDSLYTRLRMHTGNRLSGRWDRFSWFGLKRVSANGELQNPAMIWNFGVVIDTLEAVLIESLEPPLNRKRGDGLTAIEYYQVPDPEIEKRIKSEILNSILKQVEL